eukprot:TRINITY_DN4948_c0_g1_i4.p3 TRINITY_DN4948_c0_g1~~TRINITY_DN4948_c0_g1_i4.p3  ORF type:complete len:100 (-),score=20.59 TRINITY_DN4948_c0_g1_i4:271-570(-)
MKGDLHRRPKAEPRAEDPPTRESAEGSAELDDYLRRRRMDRARPNRPPTPVTVVLAIVSTVALAFLGHLSDEELLYLLLACLALVAIILYFAKPPAAPL